MCRRDQVAEPGSEPRAVDGDVSAVACCW
jgi:hypothetical protein